MAIRPVDVRRKEFKYSLRGYEANEVDDFLDLVADEFEQVYTDNSRMREQLESMRQRLEQFEHLEGSIQQALIHAERAAQDLRQSSERESESLRESAKREAELTIQEAKSRSHRILAESSERAQRVQESYEALRELKSRFADDFRQLLKGYLEVMDNTDIASAREIEASLRERVDWESIEAARAAAEQERRSHEEALDNLQYASDETQRIEPMPRSEPEEDPGDISSPPSEEPRGEAGEPQEEREFFARPEEREESPLEQEEAVPADEDQTTIFEPEREEQRQTASDEDAKEERRRTKAGKFLRRRG